MEIEKLSLTNICKGAVEEVFQHELDKLINNVRDLNTDDEAKRKISLEFEFRPYPDRSGAIVAFSVKTALAGIKPVGGTIHIASVGGKLSVFPHDPRQEVMFAPPSGGTQ